jgi:hypothetical protein
MKIRTRKSEDILLNIKHELASFLGLHAAHINSNKSNYKLIYA